MGGFGGFLGSLGGFGEKLGGLNDKLHEAAKNVPIPGLEDKIKEYTEQKIGTCRIRLNKLKNKSTDKWWNLKGTESGKSHLNVTFMDPVEETNTDEPASTVFQFYLKELEGEYITNISYISCISMIYIL